jgi:DNA-binding beta-propeller fold protein YncE
MRGHELRRVRRVGRKRGRTALPAGVAVAPAGPVPHTAGARECRRMPGFIAPAISIVLAVVPVSGARAASMTYLGTLGGTNRKIHKREGRLAVLLGLVAALLLCSAASALASPTAYVANYADGTVTPISTLTNKAGSPFKVGAGPTAIAISSNGKTAYVAAGKATRVNVIQLANHAITHSIAVTTAPEALALTPNGKDVYVAELGTSSTVGTGHGQVQEFDTKTNRIVHTVNVGSWPTSIAIAPNGKTVYVACGYGSFEILGISTATNSVTSTIPSSPLDAAPSNYWLPSRIAITPNGQTAFVSETPNFACDYGPLAVINLTTHQLVATIWASDQWPYGPVISPNGKVVYTAGNQGGVNDFIGFNTATYATVVGPTALNASNPPWLNLGWHDNSAAGIAITPNGATVYVAGNIAGRGVVIPVNAANGKTGASITVGSNPVAIAIR